MRLAAALVVLWCATARADLLNHELLRKHVAEQLAHVDLAKVPADQLYADRLTLTLGLFVPVLGTYRMEDKMFGGVRPAGVVFDWVLGGAVPAALAVAALATDGRTRSICAWTALGLYTTTRIGVFAIGTSHVTAYNREVDVLITFSSHSR